MAMSDAALEYLQQGFAVIPVAAGAKKPALVKWEPYQHRPPTEAEVRGWWERWPEANVAVVTGRVSDLTVVDVDRDKGGLASLGDTRLPVTRIHATPHGCHVLFRYTDRLRTGVGLLPGVDVRNDGGYVIMPPSRVGGAAYTVLCDRLIAELRQPPAELTGRHRFSSPLEGEDSRLVGKVGGTQQGNVGPARGGVAVKEATPYPLGPTGRPQGLPPQGGKGKESDWVAEALANGVVEGKRNGMAARLAGYFHRKGLAPELLEAVLAPFAQRCAPPMDGAELRRVIASVARYPAPQGPGDSVEPTRL